MSGVKEETKEKERTTWLKLPSFSISSRASNSETSGLARFSGTDDNKVIVKVDPHTIVLSKSLLSDHSTRFKDMIENADNPDDYLEIVLSGEDPKEFASFLWLIHQEIHEDEGDGTGRSRYFDHDIMGTFKPISITNESVLILLAVAKKYDTQCVINLCEEHLIANRQDFAEREELATTFELKRLTAHCVLDQILDDPSGAGIKDPRLHDILEGPDGDAVLGELILRLDEQRSTLQEENFALHAESSVEQFKKLQMG